VIEYALNPDIYFILPDLSISADGPVKSIYLFLKKPLEDLRNDTIVLTEFSLTSVHLIQFLLKDFLIDFTQDKTIGATGELLIADEAIKRFYDNKDPYIYDLSELWKVKTGLPFVFALWVIRRDSFYKNRKAALKLYHSILHSKGISSEFIPEMAKEKNNGIFPEDKLCEDYLKNLHYEFSKPYQRGFNLFQDKMLQLHKLQKKAPLNFLPLD
ncbi:MAG: menaquinone biosynthesis protein, partial [Deltaproteobacteria bacterium]|nr:menaquinone biosynthesis protein [Deltaproteobacteria bacterium]